MAFILGVDGVQQRHWPHQVFPLLAEVRYQLTNIGVGAGFTVEGNDATLWELKHVVRTSRPTQLKRVHLYKKAARISN